jgi:dCMP deaminase
MNKWDKRYTELAKNVSTWSKDPSKRIGAVAIGHKGQVLSQGYNGFPRGVEDAPERYQYRQAKYALVVHAEMNAIYNACHNGVSLDGSTMYVSGLPVCSECAKGIVQVGVKRVVMQCDDIPPKWADSFITTKKIFEEAGVDWEFL